MGIDSFITSDPRTQDDAFLGYLLCVWSDRQILSAYSLSVHDAVRLQSDGTQFVAPTFLTTGEKEQIRELIA
jgi:hypothetical protein